MKRPSKSIGAKYREPRPQPRKGLLKNPISSSSRARLLPGVAILHAGQVNDRCGTQTCVTRDLFCRLLQHARKEPWYLYPNPGLLKSPASLSSRMPGCGGVIVPSRPVRLLHQVLQDDLPPRRSRPDKGLRCSERTRRTIQRIHVRRRHRRPQSSSSP